MRNSASVKVGPTNAVAMPAEFNLETMSQFIDWNRSEPYKVERGEGECAV